MRWVFFHVFIHPTRLKLALLPARVMQKIGLYGLLRKIGLFKLLPPQLRKMEQMLPADGQLWPRQLPARMHGRSPCRGIDAVPDDASADRRSASSPAASAA